MIPNPERQLNVLLDVLSPYLSGSASEYRNRSWYSYLKWTLLESFNQFFSENQLQEAVFPPPLVEVNQASISLVEGFPEGRGRGSTQKNSLNSTSNSFLISLQRKVFKEDSSSPDQGSNPRSSTSMTLLNSTSMKPIRKV